MPSSLTEQVLKGIVVNRTCHLIIKSDMNFRLQPLNISLLKMAQRTHLILLKKKLKIHGKGDGVILSEKFFTLFSI